MSLAAAQPGPPRNVEIAEPLPDGIARRGLALSGILHFVIAVVLVLGLPSLFAPPAPQEMPIAVELVNIGPQTRATHPNPNIPRPEAKPVIPVPDASEAKPEPKPEPPQPAPPPSAAAAPSPQAAPSEAAPPLPPPPVPKPAPPPPKPVQQVEAPVPHEKPSAPRPTARSEARAVQQKYDPGQFDTLLKNLTAQHTASSSDARPRKTAMTTAPSSSQPRAPLGSQLSASEVDMVREQISRCWNVPAGARDAKDLVVEIRVVVNPDGSVLQATIVNQARAAGDPTFRAAAESARRAFFNPECRPLHLPPDKYDTWKDLVVDFSPKDVL
jgi:outer membrane biosynthesis protein TonB